MIGVAVAALAIPVYAFVRWMIIVTRTPSASEAVARFDQGVPLLLQGTRLEWLSAGLCLVAALAANEARGRLTGRARMAMIGVVTFAAVLGIWNVFTLM
jgi:hypothetical protein